MKKAVLYIAMSLDGYIADKNGDVSWLVGENNDIEPSSYAEFIKTIDTIIMGYNTYNQIVTELFTEGWVYKGMKTYVLTNRNISESTDDIEFTGENIGDLLSRIRDKEADDKEEKNIWICGGASIVKQFIELDLIDRYHITVIPTILGDGIRLFPILDKSIGLRLITNESTNGMVDIVYERS